MQTVGSTCPRLNPGLSFLPQLDYKPPAGQIYFSPLWCLGKSSALSQHIQVKLGQVEVCGCDRDVLVSSGLTQGQRCQTFMLTTAFTSQWLRVLCLTNSKSEFQGQWLVCSKSFVIKRKLAELPHRRRFSRGLLTKFGHGYNGRGLEAELLSRDCYLGVNQAFC